MPIRAASVRFLGGCALSWMTACAAEDLPEFERNESFADTEPNFAPQEPPEIPDDEPSVGPSRTVDAPHAEPTSESAEPRPAPPSVALAAREVAPTPRPSAADGLRARLARPELEHLVALGRVRTLQATRRALPTSPIFAPGPQIVTEVELEVEQIVCGDDHESRTLHFVYPGGALADQAERNSQMPRDLPTDERLAVVLRRIDGELVLVGGMQDVLRPAADESLRLRDGASLRASELEEVCS